MKTEQRVEISEIRMRPTRIELVDGAVIELYPSVVSVSTAGQMDESGSMIYSVKSTATVAVVENPLVARGDTSGPQH